MTFLDWLALGAYFAMVIGLALAVSRAKSPEDFAVGSRQIPGSIVIATLAAAYIGPGYSMGLANKAGANGFIWILIFSMFSLQTVLVGMFVAPKLRAFNNAYTLGDVIGQRYGKLAQFIAGVLSIFLCAGFIGAIANASGSIISTTTGVPYLWAVIVSIIVVIGYTAFGGIKAVIITDAVQFVILAVAFAAILVLVLVHAGSGVEGVLAAKTAAPLSTPKILGLIVAFLLGETLIPPYANRALIARSSREAGKAFIVAGLFSLAWFFVCASIGFIGVQSVAGADNIFLAVLQKTLPAGLYGIAIAALISTIMSTQSSLLNAAAVSFERDIVELAGGSRSADRDRVLRSQLFTIAIGAIATVVALMANDIVDALLVCYTLWAPTIVLPLIVAVVIKPGRIAPQAGLTAILIGGAATAIWEWVLHSPLDIPSLLIGVAANGVTLLVVNAIMPGKQMEPSVVAS